MDTTKIALALGEAVREIATRQENIPFKTGDLRKSITVCPAGPGRATVGSNLPYARAVHDGRPRITIRPKNKKALRWKGAAHPVKQVTQPARDGRPFLKEAARELANKGLPPLVTRMVARETAAEIQKILRRLG